MAFEPKDLSGEEWRPVLGSGDRYEVSDLGRVRRATRGKSTAVGRVLKPGIRKRDGYATIVLSLGSRGETRSRLVHRMVAEAFHGPKPTPYHSVAHNDGDPSNNRASNLRWATHAENMHDMSTAVHGTCQHGERHRSAILTEEQVKQLRSATRGGVAALARTWGVHPKTANDAASGRTWKHIGDRNGF